MISAIVLARNEEKNLKDCLEGLKWCDEILVIDDNSTDRTVRMAEEMGARVIKQSLGGDFAKQRNFGLEKAKGDWILFVDGDERVNEELKEEIMSMVKEGEGIEGYFFKRIDFFMGRLLKHGEVGSLRILRLGRKGMGEWKRRVDEIWNIKGKTKTLKNPLLHYSHQNLNEFLTSINERSTLNAEEFYQEGRKLTLIEWFKPMVKFIQNYFLRLGFLDGNPGFVFAVLMSLHSFMVRGKLFLLEKKDLK